ncbi:UNVERIFIED_CONTAM: hypothetical protein GTU68_030012 [Idotea baltica]|nr:hypothetical protein [Idotea baltica]
MNVSLHDTIAATASAAGPASRGIIRVTGPSVCALIPLLLSEGDVLRSELAEATSAIRVEANLALPVLHSPLPAALMLWPTNRSFTGQPMAEIHVLGSAPLMDAVLERVFEMGARAANRGEFTLRAFLTGRIDLVQAEAVLGVIDAADHEELETALTQLGGAVTSSFRTVRETIISLLGDLEAGLDFVEEDIEFISKDQLSSRLQECMQLLSGLDDQSEQRLPSGRRRKVVLAGLPNAGKSTLFNALAGDARAIVSDQAGTTRDYLSAVIRLRNSEWELIDTAGWETAGDDIMQQAQQLRSSTVQECDLVVWCQSADLSGADRMANLDLRRQLDDSSVPVMNVMTRCDLVSETDAVSGVEAVELPETKFRISLAAATAETKTAVSQLLDLMDATLANDKSSKGELLGSTAVRCRDSLRRTIASLQSAQQAAEVSAGDEIISIELRDALQQLGTILGEVYTDDILDHIFSNFCIGK